MSDSLRFRIYNVAIVIKTSGVDEELFNEIEAFITND